MLQDIFNALASGASQGSNQTQSQEGGDALSGLLGSLLGGQTGQTMQPTQSQPVEQPQTGGGDMLSGLLGSLMGGQASTPAPATQPQTGGGELSGLLGSLLGGQTSGAAPAPGGQVGSNPLMNLISSGQNPMVNMLVQPVVDQIAQKLGISPAIAMTVVTFAIHYMLSNHGTKLAKSQDMSGVLQQHTNQDYLHSSGMSKQLANQTGLKPAAAANALSEVFKLLGSSSPSN